MQRYFVAPEHILSHNVVITGDDVRHIHKVMRMGPGDELICANGMEQAFLCRITEITAEKVEAAIIHECPQTQELPVRITIVQGMPKGDKLEYIVQKGTECGAKAFYPYEAERSIVKWQPGKIGKKLDRLRKIAKEAAEQSHRAMIPMVNEPVSIKTLIKMSAEYQHKIVAYEETAKAGKQGGLPEVFHSMDSGEECLVVIGPEGGLSPNEMDEFKRADFIPCGLGNRILRTETASLFVLSAASYHFELINEVK
ncbi:16S rRNA (uracil1498-N3)-methyltransferase [Scopulibacillus darangshiensis]|uniref:Ribosomal RNA small subunit methyltransferase E n=1 Tax=Scopulibacillus darangshiensis TaxID=442528 RepID=A0A4R2PBG9_9BACL|nr:16S rRNA (uracil(1498)-N(3))-methyltransferase [Scopulibacillus darangshiensis]TCP32337.1 16S rRNA (uracil1498-N3)-methyltransferase [Scopulibacillus darangshiensis]